jgi:drug/metabolite transporter (DMT)-like permease
VPTARETRTGFLLALLAALAFGVLPILGKRAFAEGLDVPSLMAWRFAIASSLLWTLTLARGTGGQLLAARRRAALIGLGVVYAGSAGLYFLALERIPAATASLVFYVYPTLVSLLGLVVLKRRLRPAGWLALALSLLGVALTVGSAGGPLDPRGVALALIGATVVACYMVLGEGILTGVPTLSATAHVITGSAIAYWIWNALTGGPAVPSTARAWLLIALLATLSTAFSIVAMLGAIRRIGSGPTSILLTLEPAFTAALATLLLGESLAPRQLLGGALILCAVALVRASAAYPRPALADA